ncbi:MAG: hypothetical protein F7C37_06190 [Desulfurococcales archaeon]|nr:hypothetical protein [Desulfurococcales archaeon]
MNRLVRRVVVGVRIDPEVDREIEHLKVDTRLMKGDLYEAGAAVVLAIARLGRVPKELLQTLSPKHREVLVKVANARR